MLAHQFFVRFPFVAFYEKKDFLSAFNSAINTLTDLKNLDLNAYERIHKGFVFYFIAISAFYLHDFQYTTFFFDAAASEDIKNDPNSRTYPALLFMALDRAEFQPSCTSRPK